VIRWVGLDYYTPVLHTINFNIFFGSLQCDCTVYCIAIYVDLISMALFRWLGTLGWVVLGWVGLGEKYFVNEERKQAGTVFRGYYFRHAIPDEGFYRVQSPYSYGGSNSRDSSRETNGWVIVIPWPRALVLELEIRQ